jgi:D-alanyl-D-alanine carboxypeptidase
VDGADVTTASPFVQASVSKLVTSLTVVRLHLAGRLDITAPVPWDALGLTVDPAWRTVTPRELLDHTSGMPVARETWFDDPGDCRVPLAPLLTAPPRSHRGTWTYSNGNYCALGLLVEAVTGTTYDQAARTLVLDPAGVTTGHLTTAGVQPGDAPYTHPLGVGRLSRLGAAGQWVLATDAVAAVLATVTPEEEALLDSSAVMVAPDTTLGPRAWPTGPSAFVPGLQTDDWGHTGTVLGAKSCAWVLEGGRTVVVSTVAGESPSSGGALCRTVLPALSADLGLPPTYQPS